MSSEKPTLTNRQFIEMGKQLKAQGISRQQAAERLAERYTILSVRGMPYANLESAASGLTYGIHRKKTIRKLREKRKAASSNAITAKPARSNSLYNEMLNIMASSLNDRMKMRILKVMVEAQN